METEFPFVPLLLGEEEVEITQNHSHKIIPINTTSPNELPINPEETVYVKEKINIHSSIKQKLDDFYNCKKIPHIIFHGKHGSGKQTLVYDFIYKIYDYDKAKIKSNVMVVNCSHGKGIKFIRDELKYFAKTNIQANLGILFKTILLINAHHLTTDAQSALRRCIELFSYNTRFFIIVENKNKLLKPILSRFCEIYVPEYIENGKTTNLHQYHIQKQFPHLQTQQDKRLGIIRDVLTKKLTYTHEELADIANHFYDVGISGLDILKWMNENREENWDAKQISQTNMCFHKIKMDFRCEKLLMFYLLDFIYLSPFEIPNI